MLKDIISMLVFGRTSDLCNNNDTTLVTAYTYNKHYYQWLGFDGMYKFL